MTIWLLCRSDGRPMKRRVECSAFNELFNGAVCTQLTAPDVSVTGIFRQTYSASYFAQAILVALSANSPGSSTLALLRAQGSSAPSHRHSYFSPQANPKA